MGVLHDQFASLVVSGPILSAMSDSSHLWPRFDTAERDVAEFMRPDVRWVNQPGYEDGFKALTRGQGEDDGHSGPG